MASITPSNVEPPPGGGAQQLFGGSLTEEAIPGVDPAVRIDPRDAQRHDADLGLAHRLVEGMDLPVDVGEAHLVEIDQGEFSGSAAGQGLADLGPVHVPGSDLGKAGFHPMG